MQSSGALKIGKRGCRGIPENAVPLSLYSIVKIFLNIAIDGETALAVQQRESLASATGGLVPSGGRLTPRLSSF